MRIVTYLDRSLPDVVAGFERDDVDDVVRAAVESVLDGDAGEVRVSPPVWLTRRTVVVPIRWRDDPAVVQLVVVQTGAEPKTEAIVVLDADELHLDAASARRVVDVVTERLVA